ncbi:DUF6907 domain-containing protein [Micromonospora sp. WMMA1923]|uniref:DUF6907 domain-containing protein n=1 Tax=Micromonospora sp. WMMA1923 TaxID=3404125 RepID=UPI003B967666
MGIIASRPVRSTDRISQQDTVDLAAIPRPRPAVDDRYAGGYADGLHRAVTAGPAVDGFPLNSAYAAQSRTAAADVALVVDVAARDQAGVSRLADALRAGCPPWCTTDHADDAELYSESITDLRQHLRTITTVERHGERVARVDIVACDNLETGERTPAEVMIVDCRDSYNADETEAIAAAMLQAAAIVRASR